MGFTLADLLNSPSEFEFEGKTYKIRHATIEERGQYQRWLEQEARASAARAVELPEDDRRNLIADTQTTIAVQEYAWGGVLCVRSLRTPTGFAKFISIVCADQGVSYRLAVQMAEKRLEELSRLILDAVEQDPLGKEVRQLLRSVGRLPDYFAPSSSDSATPPTETPATSAPSPS